MKNELANVNMETGEIMELSSGNVKRETEDYMIVQLPNGKFEKRMKYKAIATFEPKTTEEEVELYKVFNEEDFEKVYTMSHLVDQEFNIVNFITKPYESFDEDTGDVTFGVITTLITDDGKYLTSSSKTVYYNMLNMYKVFKLPLRVKVTGTKRANGIQIGISLVDKIDNDDIPF